LENPFRIGERVTGEFFTNRAREVKRIRRAMAEPSRLLVYGPRRMGKSSAIRVAADRVRRDGGIVVRADLGGATSTSEVADRLLTSLARTLPSDQDGWISEWVQALRLEFSTDALGFPVLRLGVQPPSTGFGGRRALAGLSEVLHRMDRLGEQGPAPVCVVLDEFQRLTRLGGEEAAWELRDLVQGHHHLSYVCAGSEEGVIERLTSRDGAFHGAFERLYLAELPRDHFATWIDDRMASSGLGRAEGTGLTAIGLAGPRTEDVLKLARQIWFRASARGRIANNDVDRAMEELVRSDRGVFEKLWSGLTPHQQRVLRAVAVGVQTLTAQAVRERYQLRSSSAVSQAVEALARRGLLQKNGPELVFDDPFLRAWVEKELPPGLQKAKGQEKKQPTKDR